MELNHFFKNRNKSSNSTRLFSPSWDKDRYIKIVSGYSPQFIHNCVRLLIRPYHESANHWIREARTWFVKALAREFSLRERPVFALFDEVLGKNPTIRNPNWNYPHFTIWVMDVRDEESYGYIPRLSEQESRNLFGKLIELYDSIDLRKQYNEYEALDLFIDWYDSITGSNKDIVEKWRK